MVTEKIVNVSLHGGKSLFGGKEKPLIAILTHCGISEECSFHKEGTCMGIPKPFAKQCGFGKIERITGYTSRAKKYSEFRMSWKNHTLYNKLEYPKKRIGIIGNVVVLNYSHLVIVKKDGVLQLVDPFLHTHSSLIDLSEFDLELIHRIVNHKPRALMGGVIEDYQKEVVPKFLSNLKEILPTLYKEYEDKYGVKEINYVGRIALLKTLNPTVLEYRYRSLLEKWNWDGEYLTLIDGKVTSINITKGIESVELKVKPTESAAITITNNEQVNENTIFID